MTCWKYKKKNYFVYLKNFYVHYFLIDKFCDNMIKQSYNRAGITYGFIAIRHGGETLLQCVVCMRSLSNAATEPSLLECNLEMSHADKKDQEHSYFQWLGENVKRQHVNKTSQIYQKRVGIVNMKGQTIAKSLVIPVTKILVRHAIGEEAKTKLESIYISNNTIQHCIEEMLVNVADQVIEGNESLKVWTCHSTRQIE